MAASKILLAVQKPRERRQIRKRLGQDGADRQLLEASDAATLEDALTQGALDMLVVDHHLPWADVQQLIKRFYQRHPPAAVLVLVPGQAQEVAATAFGTKADAYVIKSAKYLQRLGMTIDIALASHRSNTLATREDARRNAVLHSIQDILFTLDDHARYTGVYGQWLEKKGVTPETFLGKTASEVMGSEAGQVHRLANQKALRGEHVVYEWYEGPHLYRTSLSPIWLDGSVVGLVGIGHDISDLENAYRTIELQNAALQASANTIVITNRDGIVEWANPAVKSLTGYDPAELIGQNLRVLNSGVQQTAFYQQMWHSILSGQAWRGELVNKRKDGSLYTEEMTITPVNYKGEISHFVSVKQDITQRKQAQQTLEDSERLYRSLVDTLPTGVVWHNADGSIASANPAAQRILGLSLDQMQERSLMDPRWHFIYEDGSPIPIEDYPASVVLRTGQPLFEAVVGVYKPDDGLAWVLVNGKPLRSSDQQPPHAAVVSFADITERKVAQEALKQSQLLLLQSQKAAGVGNWVIDIPTQQIEWSDRTYEIYGKPKGTPINPQLYWEMVHPDDVAMVQASWEAALRGEESAVENRILVGGQVRWVHVNSKVDFGTDGQPLRAVGAVQDITQRKQADEALRQSEERYRTLAETASDMIYIINHQYTVEYVNSTAARLMQQPQSELVGRTIFELFPRAVQEAQQSLEQVFAVPEPRYIEGLLPLPSGLLWMGTWLSPLRVEQGQIKSVLGISRDITPQRLIQDELKRLTQQLEQRVEERTAQLQQSENRLSYLLDNAPVVIFTIDPQSGQTTYVARSVQTVLGYTPADLQNQLQGDARQNLVYSEDLPGVQSFLKQLAEQGTQTLVLRVLHKSGEWRWCRLGGILTQQGEGVGYLIDVHEQRQAQQALLEALQQLENANHQLTLASRMKDDFLATMSHELRTPLTGILGLGELLESGVYGPLNEAQLHAVSTMGQSGNHLLNLINDVLDVSKIEAGKLELQLAHLEVEELCQSSLQMVQQLAQTKNLELLYEPKELGMRLYGDMRRLKQVLVNLLSNAVKFTPEGGRIGLRVWQDSNSYICFEVWDRGIGISPEDQARLFKPFVQIDNRLARSHGGTGLGLSLVKRLTEMHGGTVTLSSQMGLGSSFLVRLPQLEVQNLPELAKALAAKPTSLPQPSSPTHSVLIAEDNPVTLQLLKDWLQPKGLQVWTANNGIEAVESFNRHSPQTILMDIQMPQMDGLEAIRQIRQLPAGDKVRIIAVSALAMAQDIERCLAAGANAFMSKPLNLALLLQHMGL